MTKLKTKLIPDKMYSTFWWIIKLHPDHIKPGSDVEELTGYSKFQGHDEARDEWQMLMRKIVMLHTNGYFQKSTLIEIYHRTHEFVNKRDDDLIIKLYPTECWLADELMKPLAHLHELNTFVKKFYDCVVNGKDVKNLLPKSRATHSKDDYLNVNKITLKSMLELDQYCTRLTTNGHPFDAVVNFRRKYVEKYPQLDPDFKYPVEK